MKFKQGTMIKGKDLKGQILCKVLTEDMIMKGFQYHVGENVDINPLAKEGSCRAGLHFCLIEDILDFLCYGIKLANVEIPENEDVYVDENKFRTHRLIVKEIFLLNKPEAWEYLISQGIDITADDKYAVRYASENGHLDVVKYLHKNGTDITAANNYAVRLSAQFGHLDVVKYLHENGADITADSNCAVRYASENGHLDVVKYLHANGADITADDNYAVKWSAENGHLDVVKYLHANGADITADDNYAVRWSARNGYQDVVDYLLANGAHL